MELRATREMRRNEQLSKAVGKRADAPEAAKAPAKGAPKQPADKLSLSRQALAYAEEQRRAIWDAAQEREQRREGRTGGILEAMESKQHELDSMNEKLKTLNKCQKIAAAIMRGDRVPPEDLRYLMEHDQEGYKLALAMRRPKKDPEDVESVLDDEDKHGETSQASGGEEAPSVESAGSAEGGGDASGPAES